MEHAHRLTQRTCTTCTFALRLHHERCTASQATTSTVTTTSDMMMSIASLAVRASSRPAPSRFLARFAADSHPQEIGWLRTRTGTVRPLDSAALHQTGQE